MNIIVREIIFMTTRCIEGEERGSESDMRRADQGSPVGRVS